MRSIHERLFFRPLLEAFTGRRRPDGAACPTAAVAERLAAFGFSDAERTRQAVQELTRGFSRSSRLMQQLLPLLLEWLSESPDPDLGLLGLRSLATGQHRRDQLIALFRESPEAARRLCLLLGTSPLFVPGPRAPPRPARRPGRRRGPAAPGRRDELVDRAARSLAWRNGPRAAPPRAWSSFQQAEWLRIAGRDVLGLADVADHRARPRPTWPRPSCRPRSTRSAPPVPFAVIAMGRFGGGELSYASDLDVLLVFDGDDRGRRRGGRDGGRGAAALRQRRHAGRPGCGPLDTDLRPEGRKGPLARSLDAYAGYYERWAEMWERQALLRGRLVAGDADVGRRFTRGGRAVPVGRGR